MAHLAAYYGSVLVIGGRASTEGPGPSRTEAAERLRSAASAAFDRAATAGVAAELRQRADRLIQAWVNEIATSEVSKPADIAPLLSEFKRLGTAPLRPEDDDIRELSLLLLEFGLFGKADQDIDKMKLALRAGLGQRIAALDAGMQVTPDAYKALAQLPVRKVSTASSARSAGWLPIAAGVAVAVIAGIAVWSILGGGGKGTQQAHAPETPNPQVTAPTPPPTSPPVAAAPATPPASSSQPIVPDPPKPSAERATAGPQVAALAPRAIDGVTKQFNCAELDWASDGKGAVLLRGHVASPADKKALVAELVKLPGVINVADEVTVLPPPLCTVIEQLSPTRANNMQRALALDFRVDDEAALAAGKPLSLEVTTPNFEANILVDVFQADGKVTHLIPNSLDLKHRVPPRSNYTVGKPPSTFRQWSVAEPAGDQLILVVASREALFDAPRPEREDANAYLDALTARAKAILATDPTGIAAAMRPVAVKPKS